MKLLETKFTANADKSGNHNFTQLRKDGQIALYRREDLAGLLVGFEVFTFKTIQAGAPLPGGGTVAETYQSYPGKAAFGRTAWFVGGKGAEQRANERFNKLVQGAIKVESVDTEDETITVPVARVSRSGEVKFEAPPVGWKGTQKELAAFLGLTNYKEAYTPLQKWLGAGLLKIVGEKDSVKGKKAKIFGRV